MKIIYLALFISVLASPQAWSVQLVDGPQDRILQGRVQLAVENFAVLDVYPDRTFQGHRAFSRYELADALNRTLLYLQQRHRVSIVSDSRSRRQFERYLKPSGDIPLRHWARQAIERSLAFGLMRPEGSGFRGELQVTRYQLALSLWRLFDWINVQPVSMNKRQIADLPARHWAQPAVEEMVHSGIMSVDAQGRFDGEKPASRYMLAEALVQFLQQLDLVAAKQALQPKVIPPVAEDVPRPRADGRRYGQRVSAQALESPL